MSTLRAVAFIGSMRAIWISHTVHRIILTTAQLTTVVQNLVVTSEGRHSRFAWVGHVSCFCSARVTSTDALDLCRDGDSLGHVNIKTQPPPPAPPPTIIRQAPSPTKRIWSGFLHVFKNPACFLNFLCVRSRRVAYLPWMDIHVRGSNLILQLDLVVEFSKVGLLGLSNLNLS